MYGLLVPFFDAIQRGQFSHGSVSLSWVLITANRFVLISSLVLFDISWFILNLRSATHAHLVQYCSWQLDKLTIPLSITPSLPPLSLSDRAVYCNQQDCNQRKPNQIIAPTSSPDCRASTKHTSRGSLLVQQYYQPLHEMSGEVGLFLGNVTDSIIAQ